MTSKVAKDKVVEIAFELYDEERNLLDSASKNQPMPYIHGNGQLLGVIEKALEGKESNFTTTLKLRSDEAFGERNDALVVDLPLDHFPKDVEVKEGIAFNTSGPNGEPIIVEVIKVEGDKVTVDGNHPLAGMELEYRVEIVNVRDATKEELEHGHVHSGGGCGGGDPVH